jgi:hypothetical protein
METVDNGTATVKTGKTKEGRKEGRKSNTVQRKQRM